MASTATEGVRARPELTYKEAKRMLEATECSLEAFQERMLSSEFDVANDGQSLYNDASLPEHRPIRAWLRSADFAARVGVIEWEDPLWVFFDACLAGDEEYVSRLAKEHPEWLDKGSELHGTTVLHAVCEGGLMRLVPDLVSRFGDVDVRDRNGQTPLFHACQGGQLDVFEYLVSVGADARAVSRYDETMLHAACRGGNPAIVRALLDMGLDAKALDATDRTPLHCACGLSSSCLASLLVAHGADVNAWSAMRGETPLHCASRRGDVEMVRFLHEHGAMLDGPGSFSPFSEALITGHMDVVEYLVSMGASIENVREYPVSIVEGISARNSVSAMEWLLSRGVVSVSKELIERCLCWSRFSPQVLRCVLLHEISAPFLSHVDVSLLPAGFLGGYASLSKWREHELRMDLRYLLLSWRRGFVVSRFSPGGCC
jgi:ankyrin repeat protein